MNQCYPPLDAQHLLLLLLPLPWPLPFAELAYQPCVLPKVESPHLQRWSMPLAVLRQQLCDWLDFPTSP